MTPRQIKVYATPLSDLHKFCTAKFTDKGLHSKFSLFKSFKTEHFITENIIKSKTFKIKIIANYIFQKSHFLEAMGKPTRIILLY